MINISKFRSYTKYELTVDTIASDLSSLALYLVKYVLRYHAKVRQKKVMN